MTQIRKSDKENQHGWGTMCHLTNFFVLSYQLYTMVAECYFYYYYY